MRVGRASSRGVPLQLKKMATGWCLLYLFPVHARYNSGALFSIWPSCLYDENSCVEAYGPSRK